MNHQPLTPIEEIKDVSDPNLNSLNNETQQILTQAVAATPEQIKDLTALFNLNQKKKAMVRTNRINELLDAITDQTIIRFTDHPDEITTDQLLQGLKVVQDLIEKGQRQVNDILQDAPLIQINQQKNEMHISKDTLSRESRDKVRDAISKILSSAQSAASEEQSTKITPEILEIDAEFIDEKGE